MSAAGDLAYSYGKYSLAKTEATESGHYLQIWRTEKDGCVSRSIIRHHCRRRRKSNRSLIHRCGHDDHAKTDAD